MDNLDDNFDYAVAKVRGMNCPCKTCMKFPKDYIKANGMHIVYCEDGVIRNVDIEKGCAWHETDIFMDVTDVN